MTRTTFSALLTACLAVVFLLVGNVAFAQQDPPPPPDPVPLDGGFGLLALASTGFAASKLRKKRGE